MLEHLSTYTIPVNHPVLVHFPIAFGVMAIVFATIWLLRNRLYWLGMTTWFQGLALVGALMALRTGEAMEEQSEGIAIVDELVDYHELMAESAAWAIGISFLWMICARWIISRDTLHSEAAYWIRLVTFLLVLVSAILVGLTGHIGGLMVWGVPD
ncbi:MAG: hypothetical protein O3B41_09605 [Bacteroidetes bacterium]|nr:hypothetical protein [Bacteroidota bacterium]